MKKSRISIITLVLFAGSVVLAYLFSPWWPESSTRHDGRETVRDIPVPEGFLRVENTVFSSYLLNLGLLEPGLPVESVDGGYQESIQKYNYRLIDVPLLSGSEQCADVCMHLRADFLFKNRLFFDIHFEDTQHHTLRYLWGNIERKFHAYLRDVYEVANTESLSNEMKSRPMDEIQPGDVFVYDYHSRPDAKYGHAMLVLSVARNPLSGKKAIMLAQGSTPACSIHILKNEETGTSWFILDEHSEDLDFGFARYRVDELRCFD